MAEAVISMVAENLGNLLIEEARFIIGVRDQVSDLRDELCWMQCFLRDADARQYDDHRVGMWVREIKEIAYAAGDVLDSFIIKVESKRGEGILNVLRRFTCFVNEGLVHRKFGLEIADIGSRISKLSTQLQTYGIRSLVKDRGSLSSANQRRTQFRRTDSRVDNEDFVGLKEDVEKLVENLVTHNWKVVAICGLGGLGKTTLAKRIYHHQKVKNYFDCYVWICISQEWEPTNILQGILVKLTSDTPDAAKEIYKERDIGRLTAKISTIQRDKKCLVILDDVWHNDAADFLKNALSVENMKGKVLLTSRNSKVAQQLTPNTFIHEPPTLTGRECFELLQKKLVAELNEQDVEKKKLANEMIKECGGLPLAVIVLGGILATKQSLVEWEKVHKSIKSYIRRGEGMGRDEGGVSKILALSYNDLPYQLKSCFLYLGQFKEDTKIKTERLYQLWIAECMIMSEDRREGETMMDVAEGYLKELAQRYMVQVQLAEEYMGVGKFEYCGLHDLMRDLSLSNGKLENFFSTYDVQHEKNQEFIESSSSSTNRTRRAVVYHDGNSDKFHLDKETCQSLRSLFVHAPRDGRDSFVQMVKSTLNDLKMVRVLQLEGMEVIRDGLAIMKAVGKLCHLRYLGLEEFNAIIPSYINKLKHLQTLRVTGCFNKGYDLPYKANVLGKMSRLQHLYLPNYYKEEPIKFKLKLDGVDKLQTLEGFDSFSCEFESLLKLTNLRKLKATLRRIVELVSIIEYLNSDAAKHMRHAKIWVDIPTWSPGLEEGCSIFSEILRCGCISAFEIKLNKCVRLPRHNEVVNFSQSLTWLELIGLEVEEDPMPTLEKLPKLQYLLLWNAFDGKEMVCSKEGFPQLIALYIGFMIYLEEWVVEEGAMPKLSKLTIYDTKQLKEIPDGLKFVTTLKELILGGNSEEFERRVKIDEDGIQGLDFHKISHVPSVLTIGYPGLVGWNEVRT